MLRIYKYPDKREWKKLLQRPVLDTSSLDAVVGNILREVKENGDTAVKRFSSMFDKVTIEKMAVSAEEIAAANDAVSAELKDAIGLAKSNIEKFHRAQVQSESRVEIVPGVVCWRRNVAIEKVGLYIPGGSAPLFSTILMLAVPAKIAGCREIVLCSPPDKKGQLHPAILYTASLVGITRIVKAGGAQAIGAMAYGTASVPRVYKIFGPGNQYVTAAKQLVQKDGVPIDLPAGPSEVAVLADDRGHAGFIAADLLSQAEHGADSQVLLVTTSERLAADVAVEIGTQITRLTRRETAERALENSKVIVLSSMEKAVEVINEYAPEHLIIACADEEQVSARIINAGSVFLGNFSPESAGDYASGTNHTLPTNGYAKAYSGVSVDSFLKKITYQKITNAGLENIGKAVITMAEAEGLDGHAAAVEIRLSTL